AVFVKSKTSYVAAWPRQGRDEALADRIGDRCKYDRQGAACLLQCRHARAGRGQNDVRRKRNQLGGVFAAVGVVPGPTIVDPRITAGGPSELLQALQESREAGLSFRIARDPGHEHADLPYALALLRACRERPRRRDANERDEVAPFIKKTRSHGS